MGMIINMVGFGGYVWTSYIITVLCLSWLAYVSWQNEKIAAKLLADLKENESNKNC